nr:substrate-binding domain-containing protein [Pseudovibrio flavus]
MEAVRITGYRINQTARNLRRQQAGAVVALVPNLGNPFFSSILSGIESVLSEAGLRLLVVDSAQAGFQRDRAFDFLFMNQADGLLVLDGSLDLRPLTDAVQTLDVPPVVYCCEWGADGRYASVRIDNQQGAKLAVEHLFGLGHRQIGMVCGPADNPLTAAREEGFLSALTDIGLGVPDSWLFEGDFSIEAGAQAARHWQVLEERPTGIFCMSDEIAFGFMSELDRMGLSVPDDVSLVGFDDIEIASRFIPPLTTVRQPRFEIGQEAAGKLLRRINGTVEDCASGNNQARQTVLPVNLMVRRSTAALSEP